MRRYVLIVCLTVAGLRPTIAQACGGFFCNNTTPIVQTGERILFVANDDGSMTTIVEIQYQGPPSSFAWVVPIPEIIDANTVETAPAGLFDALEAETAPRFAQGATSESEASGCGEGCGGDIATPDMSGVDVVGSSVVGPFAIEVITAEQGDNLANWLLFNGYAIPSGADGAMQHYIDKGFAFLGVRLNPDAPEGPIDALVFTTTAGEPCIPIILTGIAATADMEIIAYVLADTAYRPENYVEVDFDHGAVQWLESGATDYEDRLRVALDDNGGRAVEIEYAGLVSDLSSDLDADVRAILERGTFLTRSRTYLSPEEMTVDPLWVPDTEMGPTDNVHELRTNSVTSSISPFGALVLLVFLRRRRGQKTR